MRKPSLSATRHGAVRSRMRLALVLRVAHAGALLVAARVTLRRPGRSLARLLAGREMHVCVPAGSGRDPAHAERLVSAAARRLPGRWTCLERAIAVRHLLARDGVFAQLRLGAALDDGGGHRFHAWLEAEGRCFDGGEGTTDFVPLAPRG